MLDWAFLMDALRQGNLERNGYIELVSARRGVNLLREG